MRRSLALGLLLIAMSLVSGGIGLSYWSEVRSYLSRAVETDGTIAAFQWVSGAAGRDSEKSFNPVVRFQVGREGWTEAPANVLTTNDAGKIGTKVTVYYDPAALEQVRLGSFQSLYGATAFFAVPALVLFLLGLFALRVGRRR